MHPALRACRWKSWREEMSSILLQVAAYGGGVAAAAAFALYVAEPPKVVAASEPTPRAEWVEIERPHPAFALSIPEAGEAPAAYAILRHGAGGGRKDVLSIGERQSASPYLWIEIYRPGRENENFGDAGSEIAARAGNLGAADAVSADEDLDSKFGPFSVVKFAVTGDKAAGEPSRKCVGFVRAYGDPRLQISGVFCQGGDYVERSMLTCALDRLTLLTSGGDLKVGGLFAQAELRRSFCGQRSTLLAPTPKYPALWKAIEQRQRASR